jgi:DnaJ-class molecular chaperone
VLLLLVAAAPAAPGAAAASIAGTAATGFYERLEVERDATEKEIKKAYRQLALKWHPDKNPGHMEEAERMFVEIAEAYETLSDPAKRKLYDAGGGAAGGGFGGGRRSNFNFDMADELFRESFGEQLWKQWAPGMTVSGTIVRDGEAFTIEIKPDGSSTEKGDEKAGAHSKTGSYTYVKSTGGNGGGTSYQIQMDGGALGELLADALLPGWLTTSVPLLAVLVSWLPTLLLGWCCIRCCFKR